ncbi:hypothetical protein N44_04746 [Microcystis aeruginosa NIES-44]|uniref:Uncharacterized protein n=1 Tax=Microcystis aeruginosa NIES-44 TaxID=449439 RepID=A0A0A1W1N8_MICAE|nr:hypothetical protein N44_04746 [Microcystis aeruginosa NIES-44]
MRVVHQSGLILKLDKNCGIFEQSMLRKRPTAIDLNYEQ